MKLLDFYKKFQVEKISINELIFMDILFYYPCAIEDAELMAMVCAKIFENVNSHTMDEVADLVFEEVHYIKKGVILIDKEKLTTLKDEFINKMIEKLN